MLRAPMATPKYKLLLVEDSEDDVILFELALKRSGLNQCFELIERFTNGEQAIQFFAEPLSMADPMPRPEIVILDIKMPGKNGFEVLTAMRDLPERPIVGVFTTSILDEDRERANALGADLFETKNFEPEKFSRFLRWLGSLSDQRRLEKRQKGK